MKFVVKVFMSICIVLFIVLLIIGVIDYKKTMIDFEKPKIARFSLSDKRNRMEGDYMGTGIWYKIYMHAEIENDGSYEFTSVKFNVFGIEFKKIK